MSLRWLLPQNFDRFARRVLVILAIGGAFVLVRHFVELSQPTIYQKDFVQEYLLGRAVLESINPYLTQSELATRFLSDARVQPHPVPHPPFVALLAVPFALFDYVTAAAIWLAVEVVLLLVLVLLIARELGFRSRMGVLLAFGAFLLWPPVQVELFYGQLTSVLAVLLLGSWLAFRHGRIPLAGVLLGAAIAIKLFPAALMAYFLVKRQWGVVLWGAVAATAWSSLAAFVIGVEGMASYLSEGLPGGASWRAGEGNYSLFALVSRVFDGSVHFAPVVDAPSVAMPVAVLAAFAVLGIGLAAVGRAKDPDAEYGLMLCAMLLASPVVWQHYLILLVWPIALLAKRTQEAAPPLLPRVVLVFSVICMTIPVSEVLRLSASMAGLLPPFAADVRLHPAGGIPLLMLLLGPGLLFGLYAIHVTAPLYLHRQRGFRGEPKNAIDGASVQSRESAWPPSPEVDDAAMDPQRTRNRAVTPLRYRALRPRLFRST